MAAVETAWGSFVGGFEHFPLEKMRIQLSGRFLTMIIMNVFPFWEGSHGRLLWSNWNFGFELVGGCAGG